MCSFSIFYFQISPSYIFLIYYRKMSFVFYSSSLPYFVAIFKTSKILSCSINDRYIILQSYQKCISYIIDQPARLEYFCWLAISVFLWWLEYAYLTLLCQCSFLLHVYLNYLNQMRLVSLVTLLDTYVSGRNSLYILVTWKNIEIQNLPFFVLFHFCSSRVS